MGVRVGTGAVVARSVGITLDSTEKRKKKNFHKNRINVSPLISEHVKKREIIVMTYHLSKANFKLSLVNFSRIFKPQNTSYLRVKQEEKANFGRKHTERENWTLSDILQSQE